MTTAEAVALVEAERQRRIEAAVAAVNAVLREHNCDLVAVPQTAPDGRIVAVIQTIAR